MNNLTKEEMDKLSSRKFRAEIFKKIISGSRLLKDSLNSASDIFISNKDTTVLKPSKEEKYIRINKEDLFRSDFSEYFEWLLAMDPEKNINQVQQDILLKDGLNLDITDEISELFKNIQEKHKELSSSEIEEEVEEVKEEIAKGSCEMSGSHGFGKSESTSAKEISKELAKTAALKEESLDGDSLRSDEIIEPDIETAMKQAKEFDSYGGKADLSTPYMAKPILSLDDIKHLNKLKHKMLKAFKGTKGKSASYSPSKRINIKKDIVDKDNIYIKTTLSEGKYLEMNILIDMSGSMSGSPIKYANSILYLFNELARDGYFKGNVIFTSDEEPYKITLPVDRQQVFNLCGARGGAEGFKDTILQYKNELKNSNVIAITDGHITDKPISHNLWDKIRVRSLGIYVNSNKDELKRSRKHLTKYFHHGIAVPNLDELVNYLVKVGLKGRK